MKRHWDTSSRNYENISNYEPILQTKDINDCRVTVKNNAKSANIRCLAAIKSRKDIFTTFSFTSTHSTLTSSRHNRYSTWVTEALEHRIANQRYQHDFFSSLFTNEPKRKSFFFLIFGYRNKGGVATKREKKLNCEENWRKKYFSVSWCGEYFFFVWSYPWKGCERVGGRNETARKTSTVKPPKDFSPLLTPF